MDERDKFGIEPEGIDYNLLEEDIESKYDPNRFMTSSERMDQQAMREARMHTEKMEDLKKKRDVEFDPNINFLDKLFFVPLNLTGTGNRGNEEMKKPLYVTIGLFILWVFMTVGFSDFVTKVLYISTWLYLIFMVASFLVVLYIVWMTMFFKIEKERFKRAETGSGVVTTDLHEVWGIDPNGLSEQRVMDKDFTKVLYGGRQSIVLKLVRQSILTADSSVSAIHYDALQQVETLLAKSDFMYTKYINRYNPKNDYIWEKLNRNLEDTVKHGADYINLMHDIMQFHYNVTQEISTLNVIYYIIYPSIKIKEMTLEDITRKIIQILENSRMAVENVKPEEYIDVLKESYGLNYLDSNLIHQGLYYEPTVRLVRYISSDGKLVDLGVNIKEEIPSCYTQEIEDKVYKIKKDNSAKMVINRLNLYEDKVYNQTT